MQPSTSTVHSCLYKTEVKLISDKPDCAPHQTALYFHRTGIQPLARQRHEPGAVFKQVLQNGRWEWRKNWRQELHRCPSFNQSHRLHVWAVPVLPVPVYHKTLRLFFWVIQGRCFHFYSHRLALLRRTIFYHILVLNWLNGRWYYGGLTDLRLRLNCK